MALAKPKLTQEQRDLCRMITPEFRASYPHVFKPQAPKPGDKLKFSVTMLYPKDSDLTGTAPDGKTPRSLKEVIKNAKVIAFGPDKSKWPAGLHSPVIDGDDPKFKDKEGYQGHWVIKASTSEDQRPGVVGRDGKPLKAESEFYPGCFARAYIYGYVYEYMGKQGVTFILDHVQKLRDGKAFGGKKPVDQVFGSLPGDEGAEEPATAGADADEDDFR